MRRLLSGAFAEQPLELDPPSDGDWAHLQNKFRCEFPMPYRLFHSEFVRFEIPIEIYNVSTGQTNGDDLVSTVFDVETTLGRWDSDLIPFCGLGNGDYFCLRASEGARSAVYFSDHEEGGVSRFCDTFDDWVRGLQDFLDPSDG